MPRGNLKGTGYILELEFAVECMKKGATVSQPIGDNAHYDVLVDNGEKIFKVQVKSSYVNKNNNRKFSINTQRRLPTMKAGSDSSSRAQAYEKGDVDLIVSKADGVWFLFDNAHQLPATVTVFPRGEKDCKNKWNVGRERWDLLKLA